MADIESDDETKVHGEFKPSVHQTELQIVSSILGLLGTTLSICSFLISKACQNRNADLANLMATLMWFVVLVCGLQACVMSLISAEFKPKLYQHVGIIHCVRVMRLLVMLTFLLGLVLILADPTATQDATVVVIIVCLMLCNTIGVFRQAKFAAGHKVLSRAVFAFIDTVQLFAVHFLAYSAVVFDVDRSVLPWVAIASTTVFVIDSHIAFVHSRAAVLWGVLWILLVLLFCQSLLWCRCSL